MSTTIIGSGQFANVFVYRPAGTAGGQVYTDMEKCYQDVLKATAASSKVGGPGFNASIVLIVDAATMPPRAANAAYDLSNVTLHFTQACLILDGVNFFGSAPSYGLPIFSAPLDIDFLFECTTTSVYIGPVPRMYFEFGQRWDTGPTATVPAFHFNSGVGYVFLRYAVVGFPIAPSGSAFWHLSGGAYFGLVLREFGWINGNPITDDGGGDETVELSYWDANTVLGVFADSRPFERPLGTTAAKFIYGGDVIEGLTALLSSPGKIPVHNYQPGGGFVSTYVSRALTRTPNIGAVILGSTTSLVGDGIIFTGITHDTMSSFLGSPGWQAAFDTAAVIGDAVGWATTTKDVCHLEGYFFAHFFFHTVVITDIRGFWGLTGDHVGAGRAGVVGTDTPTGDLIGIQVSTDRGDTTYQFLTQQTGGAPNLIDTGVALTTFGVRFTLRATGGPSPTVTFSMQDYYGVELFGYTETTAANLPLIIDRMGIVEMIETRAASVATLWHGVAQISLGEDV